jgi:hypothetical protein
MRSNRYLINPSVHLLTLADNKGLLLDRSTTNPTGKP